MYKVIRILCFSAFVFSCSPFRHVNVTGFVSKQNVIFFQNDTMAVLSNVEYALDNNKLIRELTFKLKNQKHADRVKDLIYFIHSQHKNWEIEIDMPIPQNID
jgi:hypothetical protein